MFFFFGDSGKGHANAVFRPSRFFDPRHLSVFNPLRVGPIFNISRERMPTKSAQFACLRTLFFFILRVNYFLCL